MFPFDVARKPVIDWFASGSRVIVNPPPTNTDEDWAVFVTSIDEAITMLTEKGFKMEGNSKAYDNDEFRSFRRGELNLIVFWDMGIYERFRMATEVAKALNLSVKSDRVKLFQTIRDVGRHGFNPPVEERNRRTGLMRARDGGY